MLPTDAKTLAAIEHAQVVDPEEKNLIRLSSGVVLRGRKASASMLIEVLTSFRRPKPPTWKDPKMGRMMENYQDPDYLEQVQAYKQEQAGALVTAMILLGTELYSVPDGMEGPHGFQRSAVSGQPNKKKAKAAEETPPPQWIEEYALLNLPMAPENPRWRYLTWIKFLAAPTDEDLKLIQETVGRLSGIREADAEAAEDFPGRNQAN